VAFSFHCFKTHETHAYYIKHSLAHLVQLLHWQVEEFFLSFTAKITNVDSTSSSYNGGYGGSMQYYSGGWWSPYSVTSSYGAQWSGNTQTTNTAEYSMDFYVKGKQAPVPSGLKRMMDIFEQAIQDTFEATVEPAAA
jgi:hypothetical protein